MEHERVPVLVTEYLQALGLAGIETGRCRPPPPELLQVTNGCQVLEAATGEEAVSLIDGEDQQLDVLFTDIRLGGQLNGWDVAEIFRKHRPAMRVLYASGYSIDPPRHVSDSQFFNKPYRPEDILKACKP